MILIFFNKQNLIILLKKFTINHLFVKGSKCYLQKYKHNLVYVCDNKEDDNWILYP